MGFPGLRRVRQTGGFEDAGQLHLFCGDPLGSPGSVITFLVWQDRAAAGSHWGRSARSPSPSRPGSMGAWLKRATTAGVPATAPAREPGEPVLCLRDPDGIVVTLLPVRDSPARTLAVSGSAAPTRLAR